MSLGELIALRDKYVDKLDHMDYKIYSLLERKFGEGNIHSYFDYNSRVGLLEWDVYVKDDYLKEDLDVKVVEDIARIYGLEFHSEEKHNDPCDPNIKWVNFTYYEKKE